MKIFKCDRCGKDLKPMDGSVDRYISKKGGNITAQFELCKDCADDFDFDLGCMNMKYSKFKDKYMERR